MITMPDTYTVESTERADNDLAELYEYIVTQSPQNAREVKQ
jgi:plasmid stabilization system protein ParE